MGSFNIPEVIKNPDILLEMLETDIASAQECMNAFSRQQVREMDKTAVMAKMIKWYAGKCKTLNKDFSSTLAAFLQKSKVQLPIMEREPYFNPLKTTYITHLEIVKIIGQEDWLLFSEIILRLSVDDVIHMSWGPGDPSSTYYAKNKNHDYQRCIGLMHDFDCIKTFSTRKYEFDQDVKTLYGQAHTETSESESVTAYLNLPFSMQSRVCMLLYLNNNAAKMNSLLKVTYEYKPSPTNYVMRRLFSDVYPSHPLLEMKFLDKINLENDLQREVHGKSVEGEISLRGILCNMIVWEMFDYVHSLLKQLSPRMQLAVIASLNKDAWSSLNTHNDDKLHALFCSAISLVEPAEYVGFLKGQNAGTTLDPFENLVDSNKCILAVADIYEIHHVWYTNDVYEISRKKLLSAMTLHFDGVLKNDPHKPIVINTHLFQLYLSHYQLNPKDFLDLVKNYFNLSVELFNKMNDNETKFLSSIIPSLLELFALLYNGQDFIKIHKNKAMINYDYVSNVPNEFFIRASDRNNIRRFYYTNKSWTGRVAHAYYDDGRKATSQSVGGMVDMCENEYLLRSSLSKMIIASLKDASKSLDALDHDLPADILMGVIYYASPMLSHAILSRMDPKQLKRILQDILLSKNIHKDNLMAWFDKGLTVQYPYATIAYQLLRELYEFNQPFLISVARLLEDNPHLRSDFNNPNPPAIEFPLFFNPEISNVPSSAPLEIEIKNENNEELERLQVELERSKAIIKEFKGKMPESAASQNLSKVSNQISQLQRQMLEFGSRDLSDLKLTIQTQSYQIQQLMHSNRHDLAVLQSQVGAQSQQISLLIKAVIGLGALLLWQSRPDNKVDNKVVSSKPKSKL